MRSGETRRPGPGGRSTGSSPAVVYYCPPWQSGPATGLAAGRPPPAKEFRMGDAGATDRRLSDRLAHVQEALRSLLARTTDQAVLEGIEAAALELGLIRLGLDAPSQRSRSAHIRVKETNGHEIGRAHI